MAKATLFRRTPSTIQIGLQCSMKAFPSDPGLAIGSTWRLSLVFRFAFLFLSMKCLPHVFASLSTLHREYSALMGVDFICDHIQFYRCQFDYGSCQISTSIVNITQIKESVARCACIFLFWNSISLRKGGSWLYIG